MTAKPLVSVVIPTLGRPDRLDRALSALEAQTLARDRFEVLVVHDPGDPATVGTLERHESGVRLVGVPRGPEVGPGPARNLGWVASEADLVAFTDDDCEPEADWLANLASAASNSQATFVQGRTIPHPDHPRSAYSRSQTVEALGPWFPTCNICYPRSLLERLGGFSEDFAREAAGEDTDLAYRAIDAGAEPIYAPDAVVRHEVADLGPLGLLRVAWRWHAGVALFRRHPVLRGQLIGGVFWRRTHLELVLAVAGVALSRHTRLGYLLAIPWLRNGIGRSRARGAPRVHAVFWAAHDAAEVAAMVRGSIRNRTLVL